MSTFRIPRKLKKSLKNKHGRFFPFAKLGLVGYSCGKSMSELSASLNILSI